jgi:hypothetical protein
MKIYIVSSGEYSDYGIDRIFLDEEKAKRYVELSQNGWNSTRLEEWETSDDEQIDEITYIYAHYSKGCKYRSSDSMAVEIRKTNGLDDREKAHIKNYFWFSDYSGEKQVLIERVLKGNYEEEKLKSKYTKVCYDLMAKIDSLLSIEGWNEKMIQEWLGQNIEEYLDKN